MVSKFFGVKVTGYRNVKLLVLGVKVLISGDYISEMLVFSIKRGAPKRTMSLGEWTESESDSDSS